MFRGKDFAHSDWPPSLCGRFGEPRMIGTVDIWIDYIRQALGDSQSIVAVPVTGSLVSPTLFSCRDAIYTARSSIYWIVCVGPWMLMVSR